MRASQALGWASAVLSWRLSAWWSRPQPSPGPTEASALGPLPPQAALPRRQGNFSKSLSLNLSVPIQAGEALGQGRGLLPRHPAPSPGSGTEMMRRHGNPSLIPALPGPAASPPVPLLKFLLSHRSGLERALPAPSCFRLRELFPLPGTPSPHPSDQLTVPQLLALRASLSPEQPFPALRLNSSLPRSPPLPAEPPPQRLPVSPGAGSLPGCKPRGAESRASLAEQGAAPHAPRPLSKALSRALTASGGWQGRGPPGGPHMGSQGPRRDRTPGSPRAYTPLPPFSLESLRPRNPGAFQPQSHTPTSPLTSPYSHRDPTQTSPSL